jgi:hypothetical protein
LKILTGQETVPGATIFNVFAATLAKLHDPIFAPIELTLDLDKRVGSVRVAGIIDTAVEPIRNPITGAEHRARVVLPNGFEYHEAEFASGNTRANGPIKLSFDHGHSHVYEMHLTTQGVR